MRIEHLYRFPVKGLTAEALESVEVEEDDCIPWDRAFALAQGDAPLEPENPSWLPKRHFMCLMRNARIAALRSSFEPRSGTLSIRAPDGTSVSENALDETGRARIAAFLTHFLEEEARGTPRFCFSPGHSFCDQRDKVISLINLASLHDYERRIGAHRHRRRFRANVWFAGATPWAERDWIGGTLQLGGATLQVVKPIARCPATEVNPESAERDADPVAELRATYGSINLGVHAKVIAGGRFSVGDSVELLPT